MKQDAGLGPRGRGPFRVGEHGRRLAIVPSVPLDAVKAGERVELEGLIVQRDDSDGFMLGYNDETWADVDAHRPMCEHCLFEAHDGIAEGLVVARDHKAATFHHGEWFICEFREQP